ncbi:BLUF domain-containing protein [Rhodobacteraceae bacterium NNCM2]|nr:BLUF domain-containing protein [Coraliihabitans acroporae]
MIFRLIYISRSKIAPISDAITDIANESLSHNPRHGITGFLYFDESSFIQEIEGIADDVLALFDRIAVDERHEDVRVVLKQRAETRAFAEWSMAFYRGRDEANRIRGEFGDGFVETLMPESGPSLLRVLRELSLSSDCEARPGPLPN